MPPPTLTTWIMALVLLAGASGAAAERESPEGGEKFFLERIKPLLAARCVKCHGAEKQENELRLDTYEGLSRGGASGELYVAGKPEQSLLYLVVTYENEDLQMPPDAKLSAQEIDEFRQWIARGAPHPDAPRTPVPTPQSERVVQGREFWAFQSPAVVPVPQVRDTAWPRSAIDHFVLARLEQDGLAPSPRAAKAELVRRVTFDLIGLPPTSEEVDAFLSDESPDAWERLVDRLLASPHYGERWGRHWLDVARYADSNGLDENVAHGNAWRYRDYVIRAFNDDKPYDQFVREQIAGDLLTATDRGEREERLIATGFLSLGAKVLAEVDERKMEMDIVDEQVDTLGRALLGLTLGCARCHDHKFDPIRMKDYYALAGIFRSTKTMETFKKVAKWHEHSIATPDELAAKQAFDQEVAAKKGAIDQFVAAANQALLESLGPDATLPAKPETNYPAATQAELKKLRDELAAFEKSAPLTSTAMGVDEGAVADTEVCIRGSHLTLGEAVPRGVPLVLTDAPLEMPTGESGRQELAAWLVDGSHPLTARVMVNRIWRWHFGRGLVESTDNFGLLGDRPVNQPLLDWLAHYLVEQNWSIKELQRLIVTSATYCQSAESRSGRTQHADASQAAELVDPDNRLLWHFPLRRLEAEAIRDALLAVSDQLDVSLGGSLLHVGNREYLFDHTSKDATRYDSQRRTVYLPVIRNNLYDVFQLFDGTDATVSNGDRTSSTVSTQALFIMNSPLALDAARRLAELAQRETQSDEQRVPWLYRRCFGREPAEREVARALAFVRQFASSLDETRANRDAEAWTALCHVLLASNEFIHIR